MPQVHQAQLYHPRSYHLHILGSVLFFAILVNTSAGYVNPSFVGSYGSYVGQLSFWVVLIISTLMAVSYKRSLHLPIFILVTLVLATHQLRFDNAQIASLYRLLFSVSIATASGIYVIKADKYYRRLLHVFIVTNFVLLILQKLGIWEFVHYWNSYFMTENLSYKIQLKPILFIPIEQLTATFHQIRPPGIFYSNSVNATFLILALAYRLGGDYKSFSFIDVVLILSTILAGAKISMLFLICCSIACFVFNSSTSRVQISKFITLIPVLWLFSYLFFPGAMDYAYSLEMLVFSIGIRVSDLLLSFNVNPDFMVGYLVGNVQDSTLGRLYSDNTAIGGRSGLRLLIIGLPVLAFLFVRLYKKAKNSGSYSSEQKRAMYLFFGFIFTFAGTNLLGSTLVAFMVGPIMAVLISGRRSST